MNRTITTPPNRLQITFASTTVGLAVICLLLSAQTEHVNIVAGRPISVPGLPVSLPIWFLHYLLPILLAISVSLTLFLGPLSLRLLAPLRLLCVVALTIIWLQTLVRHELPTSLYQGALLILPLLPARLWKVDLVNLLPSGIALVLVCVVTYGAIYGETRCAESSYVQCHTTEGPRVWVPRMLNALGTPAFANLQNENLEGAVLAGANLRYANFSNAILKGATLKGTNLRRAQLDRIQADGSYWHSAYLDGASLSNAVLIGADLRQIHAYRVNLRGANLRNADARGASLSHAEMYKTTLEGTRLENTYLRFAENLQNNQLAEACGNRATRLSEGLVIRNCETSPPSEAGNGQTAAQP